jgi:hypothetical protein
VLFVRNAEARAEQRIRASWCTPPMAGPMRTLSVVRRRIVDHVPASAAVRLDQHMQGWPVIQQLS